MFPILNLIVLCEFGVSHFIDTILCFQNVEVNYLVTKVVAEDSDPGENGRVTYHLRVGNNDTQSTDEFYIDENNGELRTSVILDREKKASFQVSI